MLYVGVDAHRKKSMLAVVDESGRVLDRKHVASSRMAIVEALGGYDQPLSVVHEASYCWGPMHDWLEEVADQVVLAHPMKVRAIAEARIKTDTIDSQTLAHLLRCDLIPPAYAPTRQTRAVKRVLRQRCFLVQVRTMAKNRIAALLAQHELRRPAVTDLYGRAGMQWLGQVQLPAPDDMLLSDHLDLIQWLNERIGSTETLLRKLSTGDPAVTWLRSIPGIGPFLSVLIRYETDDITRFAIAAKFAAYTGLVPSTYASGDRHVHGRITRQGNKWLRWAFVEAVWPAIQCSAFFGKTYQRIKRRRGVKDAKIATARKIAQIVWTVWTEQRCYEER